MVFFLNEALCACRQTITVRIILRVPRTSDHELRRLRAKIFTTSIYPLGILKSRISESGVSGIVYVGSSGLLKP